MPSEQVGQSVGTVWDSGPEEFGTVVPPLRGDTGPSLTPSTTQLRAPTDNGPGTGDPWCHFGTGLHCLNGEHCLNPNHRGEQ
jgi:hypothetical protein